MANAAPRSVLSVWQTLPAVRWGTLALVLGVYDRIAGAVRLADPEAGAKPRRTNPGRLSLAAPGIVIAEPPHDWR